MGTRVHVPGTECQQGPGACLRREGTAHQVLARSALPGCGGCSKGPASEFLLLQLLASGGIAVALL